MNLTVVGTGYVGLVSGTCFAEMGNQVTCVDVDAQKVDKLKRGIIPIYEPGLEPMVKSNHMEGRLQFTTSLPDAMTTSNVFFIAVGTPPGEDGSADLKYVLAVAKEIGENLNNYAVIVDKSTVPVGTADKVKATIQTELDKRGVDVKFDVVSNPEFLKEGAAIEDFMKPDRIVVGVESEKAQRLMSELYAPFSRNHDKVMYMGVRDAELTKYAANAMLATRISFMNELANLAERMDVDIEQVRRGIGSDPRIGYSFIYPGCGYGGSCFPKDVQALVRMGDEYGFETEVLKSVETRNYAQKNRLFEKVTQRFGADLSGHHFGVWGLAFKPGTDDMREATSIVLIKALIAAGATVTAYDPVAQETARVEFPAELFESGKLVFSQHQYDALQNASAMLLVTEWKPFRQPDFDAMKRLMKTPVIFDGRNQYEPKHAAEYGFEYYGIGRGQKLD